ncbi:MAG TPA: hypothetical protein PKA33_01575 [Amaricoccus sp.]|uniref:hypothetical protein n=1 Tax=Amaricoccus sp. TaxID=1872485 RepID=UPI002BA47A18|nr:hypothetical protein [Amaricoccus sp.]HMR51215.1 hypothetical protein [Amaricoccus sp.]HMT98036.1 hypothetical protein [Amaricoccus sp.]
MTASARGLFRATGKAAKPVAVRGADGGIVRVEAPEREGADFYPTPREPVLALLDAEMERLRDFTTIWEPACGDGAMARIIEAAGFDVEATDLHDRGYGRQGNFFAIRAGLAPAIITNPPYQEVNWRDGRGRWITHALDVLGVEYMALLLSWSWPGAGGLAPVWAAHPPARVYLMRWKIDFTGQGAPPMLNGWFVWDRAWRGETVLRMLDRVADWRQAGLGL